MRKWSHCLRGWGALRLDRAWAQLAHAARRTVGASLSYTFRKILAAMPPKGAAGWLAGVLLTLPLYAWTASGAAPPNIVFILVDDMESSLVGVRAQACTPAHKVLCLPCLNADSELPHVLQGDWHMPLLARHLTDEG